MKKSIMSLCCRIYDHFRAHRHKKDYQLKQGYPQDSWASTLKFDGGENQDLMMSLLNSNLRAYETISSQF